jgi:hypothetical protein
MRACLVLLVVAAAACGGPQINQGNGYKVGTKSPWKKAKTLAFNEKLETKADGSLSYPENKRAHWYAIDLPTNAELTYRLEITPPGDGTNDDFDLACEILNPANHVISKADQEDSDAHELVKTHTLLDLPPGHYLVHLYLQGRLDTADYTLAMSYKPVAPAEQKSDFPAQVAFLPALAMVPLQDDTPANYRPKVVTPQVTTHVTHHGGHAPTPKPEAPPPSAVIVARIINLQVSGGGTTITVSRGSDTGASVGMPGHINGVSNGAFKLGACNARTCTASVAATPDQIKTSGGAVTLGN